jgi:hypothetical protein
MTRHNPATPAEQPANHTVSLVTDAGWHRIGEAHGAPLWQWQEDTEVRVATFDHDVLRIIAAILNHRDKMTEQEEHEFLAENLLGGRSGTPNDKQVWVIAKDLTNGRPVILSDDEPAPADAAHNQIIAAS